MTHALIVDDLEEGRYLLRAMLEAGGYRVTEAANGLEALAAARREAPDVIVSDMLMPTMDGFTLCRIWMRDGVLRNIPFVFYTATYTSPGDEKLALALGAVRYLVKPQEPEVFLAELHRVLDEWAARRAPALGKPLSEAEFHAGHEAVLAGKLDDKLAQLEAARRNLARSERIYRQLFEANPQPMWVYDLETLRFLAVNDAALAHYGYSRDEFLAMTRADIRPASEIPRMLASVAAVVNEGRPESGVWRHLKKDGTPIDVEIMTHEIDFEGRRANMVLAIDVTERLRAERALLERDERLRAIVDASPVPMATNDEHGSVTFLNRKFIETFGYTLADIPSLADWWPRAYPDPEYRQRVAREWQAAVDQALRERTELKPMEYRVTGKDGAVRDIRFSMAPMGASSLVILYDVSESRRAEEALRMSEAHYRTLIEQAADAVVIAGPDGRVRQVNRRACELFGYAPGAMVGLPLSALVAESERERQSKSLRRLLAGKRISAERLFLRRDGSLFPGEISACQMEGGLALGLVRDITERQRVEDALREGRARLEALTRRLLEVQETERRTIARELHDEVGGVLTAVKLNLQSLRGMPAGESGADALTDALALVDGAIRSVRSLSLDLRPAMLDDLGLIPTLKWYCERQARRAGVPIELALDAIDLKSAPPLESACFRMVQESVTNALRYSNAKCIQVALRHEDGRFVVEVADDGAGFDVAAARRRGLAGECVGLLGLEERARLLGGRFSIDSAAGAGARVRTEFPMPDAGAA